MGLTLARDAHRYAKRETYSIESGDISKESAKRSKTANLISFGLRASAGTANVAKKTALILGGTVASVFAFDTYSNAMGMETQWNRQNYCGRQFPTTMNVVSALLKADPALESHDCSDPGLERFSQKVYGLQALAIPAILAATSIVYITCNSIQNGLKRLDKKLFN